MNYLTEQISEEYNAIRALVVYRGNGRYYLEAHPITNGQMGAGSPMQQEDVQDVVNFFYQNQRRESVLHGEIPAGLIYTNWGTDNKVMVWRNPARLRRMYFTAELAIKNGEAYQPELVYVLKNGYLSIYATDAKGKLYRAPYHNVDDAGDVCLGSAKGAKPRTHTYAAVIGYYETLFWQSEFSHLHGNSSPVTGNLNTYWKRAIAKKHTFDTDILLPVKSPSTISQLISKL